MPAQEAPPRFARRGSSADKPSPARHVPRLQPAVEENPRTGRTIVALLVGGALAAGAVAGSVAAGSDEPPAPHPQASAAGLSVELPDGWSQRPAEAGRLAASRARSSVGAEGGESAASACSARIRPTRCCSASTRRGTTTRWRRTTASAWRATSSRPGPGRSRSAAPRRRALPRTRSLSASARPPRSTWARCGRSRWPQWQGRGSLAGGRQPAQGRSGRGSRRPGAGDRELRPDPGRRGARRNLRARRPPVRRAVKRAAGGQGRPRHRRHLP